MSALSQAADERHWYDLAYWLRNFPQVRLNPDDNTHVEARLFCTAWSSSAAPPIVAVEILPREEASQRKPGDLDWMPITGAIIGIIPGIGTVGHLVIQAVKIGIGVAHNVALADWANSFQASPDEFSPQYKPLPFLVPMPLDRAQIMVSRPWYAPAMVYQFATELQTDSLRTTSKAYADLLKAMLLPGQADPPAYTHGEAPLFRFLDLGGTLSPTSLINPATNPTLPALPVGTSPGGSGTLGTTSLPASNGVLPLLVAAGLLVAGAPVVLVVVVGAAMVGLAKK